MTDRKRVSHSQLQTFFSCEQKWYYNYVEQLIPKQTKKYFAKGTLIHEVLSVYYQLLQQGHQPGSETVIDMVMEFAQSDLQGDVPVDDLTLYAEVLKICLRYMRDFSPVADAGLKVLDIEYQFEIPLVTPKGREFLLEGYIDFAYADQYDKVWIVDHKSVGNNQFWTPEQLLLDSQMLTYAAALREQGIDVFGIVINNISTYPYKDYWAQPVDKVFRRISAYRSANELDFAIQNYCLAVDEMFDRIDDPTRHYFRKLNRDCTRCPYSELCLYEVKGIETSGLKSADFKPKDQRTQSGAARASIDDIEAEL